MEKMTVGEFQLEVARDAWQEWALLIGGEPQGLICDICGANMGGGISHKKVDLLADDAHKYHSKNCPLSNEGTYHVYRNLHNAMVGSLWMGPEEMNELAGDWDVVFDFGQDD